jgi:hypothetical protein
MSEYFITKRGIYKLTPGVIALYELFQRHDPETAHIILLEIR